MAIRINYSKCYNNNDNQIGKSNKMDGISIDLKNITYTEENVNSYEYNIDNKTFYTTDYEIYSDNPNLAPKQRSLFYTRIIITLSYLDYPNLINAKSINIPEENIIKTGTIKLKQDMSIVGEKASKIPNPNMPIFDETFFDDATVRNIVEEKTQDNEISYSELVNELNDTYSFTGSRVGSATTKWYYEKKDTYMIIYVDIATKIQQMDALIVFTAFELDFDYIKFDIEYTAPSVEILNEETIYGSEIGNVTSFSSDLFVNGNTISGLDYSYYFAQSELAEFRNGKNILSLTLPVGNFEVDYNTTDLLNINDRCYVEVPQNKDWITVTNSFSFQSTIMSPIEIPHIFSVDNLIQNFKTSFTGRIIWSDITGKYFDFDNAEFPLIMTGTAVVDNEIEVSIAYIFTIVNGGIMVTTTSSNPDLVSPPTDLFQMHCENGIIKQYKTPTIPFDTDENGESQTYKVIYTNVRYEDGKLLEDVKLLPIRGEYQNIIFEHTDNVLTGIKDEYIDSTTILNIPAEIDGDFITEIAEDFATNNNNIEKINIPYTINKIGKNAFSYMQGIRSTISLPSSLVSIENMAFYGSTISGDLIIPEGVTKIGHYSFAECNKLDGVLSIPSTYKFPSSDGDYQFYNTSNLKRIIIYSDQIQTDQKISAFDNTGSCDIYVLDNLVETFKQKMPNVTSSRIKSISTMS